MIAFTNPHPPELFHIYTNVQRQSCHSPNASEVNLWNTGKYIQRIHLFSWWRHQMEPFSALLALCAGNSPVTGEFPSQRPVTWNFDIFFDLRMNKRFSKQSYGWWFETPPCSLWRYCYVLKKRLHLETVDNGKEQGNTKNEHFLWF